jgi:hypothetical protein
MIRMISHSPSPSSPPVLDRSQIIKTENTSIRKDGVITRGSPGFEYGNINKNLNKSFI